MSKDTITLASKEELRTLFRQLREAERRRDAGDAEAAGEVLNLLAQLYIGTKLDYQALGRKFITVD